MGIVRVGKLGFFLSLFIITGFVNRAYAEFSSVTALLAPALFGVTERKIDNDYSEKLKIDSHATVTLSMGASACTGTFLSSNTLLTAVHCVDQKDETGGVNVDGIESIAAYYSKEWKKSRPDLDVALVIFPQGTAEFLGIRSFPKIAKRVSPGDRLYLVGFGMESYEALLDEGVEGGAGVKGWGTTRVHDVENGVITTEPTKIGLNEKTKEEAAKKIEDRSFALPGDSGGAVYNEAGEIVGVVSLVAAKPQTKPAPGLLGFFGLGVNEAIDFSNNFADLTSGESESLLARALTCEEERLCAFHSLGSMAGAAVVEKTESSGPFDHVTLRTGFYTSSKDAKRRLFVRAHYLKKQIAQLSVAILEDGKAPTYHTMVGIGPSLFFDIKADWMGRQEKGEFFLARLEKDAKDPNKRETGEFEEFAYVK